MALNGVLLDGDVEKAYQHLQSIDDKKFTTIFEFLYSHNLAVNLFDKFNVDRIFELRILSVDQNYRGQGIARSLVNESERVAAENGFKLVKLDATSLFTQKLSATLGFITASEKRFDEYRNENGEVIIQVEPPHVSTKIMYKLLDRTDGNGI